MSYNYQTPDWCIPNSERDVELKFLLNQIYNKSGNRDISVLDVGFAGCGYIPQILDMESVEYTGLDGDPDRISGRALRMKERDRKEWINITKRIKYINTNIINYTSDKKYDIVMAISVIEHIVPLGYSNSNQDEDSDIKAIESMKNLVKDDGILLLTFPCGRERKFVSEKNDMRNKLIERGFEVSRHNILIYDEVRYKKIIGSWTVNDEIFSVCENSKFTNVDKDTAFDYYHKSSHVRSICSVTLGRGHG